MSLYSAYSKYEMFAELDDPLFSQGEGVITPTVQRQTILDNLIGDSALSATWGAEVDFAFTSASTASGTSVEPLNINTTMTGAGGVGGRARFYMTTEVELGSWANALKAEVDWGDAGAVTGLGSAAVIEATFGAGTEAGGTYGVLELEANFPADSGETNAAFIYASMQGAEVATADDAVAFLSINGCAAGAGSLFQTFSPIEDPQVQGSLKITINGTEWFIPLMDTQVGT